MNQSILSIILASTVMLTMTQCTTTNEEDVDDARIARDKAKVELAEANKAYEKEVKQYRQEQQEIIEDNQELINNLKAQRMNLDKKTQLDRETRIFELENRNNELRADITNYRGNKDNWEEFKEEFTHDLTELGKAFNEFSSNDVNN